MKENAKQGKITFVCVSIYEVSKAWRAKYQQSISLKVKENEKKKKKENTDQGSNKRTY